MAEELATLNHKHTAEISEVRVRVYMCDKLRARSIMTVCVCVCVCVCLCVCVCMCVDTAAVRVIEADRREEICCRAERGRGEMLV